jgi:hypothetical protein
MSRLKIIYIASLIILGVLIASTVFRPMTAGGTYSEIQREQLLQAEDEWIIQLDIANHEGKDQNYTINFTVDGIQYSESVLIKDRRLYTYIHHIHPDSVATSDVSYAIYKEGEDTPFEEGIYHLANPLLDSQ